MSLINTYIVQMVEAIPCNSCDKDPCISTIAANVLATKSARASEAIICPHCNVSLHVLVTSMLICTVLLQFF